MLFSMPTVNFRGHAYELALYGWIMVDVGILVDRIHHLGCGCSGVAHVW